MLYIYSYDEKYQNRNVHEISDLILQTIHKNKQVSHQTNVRIKFSPIPKYISQKFDMFSMKISNSISRANF